MSTIREEIAGAVARGWCHPKTEHLVMDESLAYAIVDEVEELWRDCDKVPRLGLATTMELLDELGARASIAMTVGESWPNYRTVSS